MAGVKGRSGRHRRNTLAMTASFDQVADLTFREAWIALNDPSIDRLDKLRVCMPLALKRIPDKVESTSLVLNISDDDAQAMLAEARANLLIYKELRADKSNQQDIPTIDTTS